jgi:hypothetical protein
LRIKEQETRLTLHEHEHDDDDDDDDGNETLHVADSSSVHHQELFTVHSAMVYVIQVCRQLTILLSVE